MRKEIDSPIATSLVFERSNFHFRRSGIVPLLLNQGRPAETIVTTLRYELEIEAFKTCCDRISCIACLGLFAAQVFKRSYKGQVSEQGSLPREETKEGDVMRLSG